jgi:hypothetical protein
MFLTEAADHLLYTHCFYQLNLSSYLLHATRMTSSTSQRDTFGSLHACYDDSLFISCVFVMHVKINHKKNHGVIRFT